MIYPWPYKLLVATYFHDQEVDYLKIEIPVTFQDCFAAIIKNYFTTMRPCENFAHVNKSWFTVLMLKSAMFSIV